MAIQIVMDHTGDTRHWFNPNGPQGALSEADRGAILVVDHCLKDSGRAARRCRESDCNAFV